MNPRFLLVFAVGFLAVGMASGCGKSPVSEGQPKLMGTIDTKGLSPARPAGPAPAGTKEGSGPMMRKVID